MNQYTKVNCLMQNESEPFQIKATYENEVPSHIQAYLKKRMYKSMKYSSLDKVTIWKVSFKDEGKRIMPTDIDVTQMEKMDPSNIRNSEQPWVIAKPGFIQYFVESIYQTQKDVKRKKNLHNNWKPIIAGDGEFVDVPDDIYRYLDSNTKFTPKPPGEFTKVLQNVQAGQIVSLPSLGQLPFSNDIGDSNTNFVITQQMLDMWQTISKDHPSHRTRFITGPIGSGKSYLTLFLAAKAYSEGCIVLYIPNYRETDSGVHYNTDRELWQILFSFNKHNLTSSQISTMFSPHINQSDYLGEILYGLQKVHVVADEFVHSLYNCALDLCGNNYNNWPQFILTGQRNQELYEDQSLNFTFEHVRPLPENEFNRLLELDPILNEAPIATKIRKFVNGNPRELLQISKLVKESETQRLTVDNIDDLLKQYQDAQCAEEVDRLVQYFQNKDSGDVVYYIDVMFNAITKYSYNKTLVHMSLKPALTGLVYYWKDEQQKLRLCMRSKTSEKILFEVFKKLITPKEIHPEVLRLLGTSTSKNFETTGQLTKEGWLLTSNFEKRTLLYLIMNSGSRIEGTLFDRKRRKINIPDFYDVIRPASGQLPTNAAEYQCSLIIFNADYPVFDIIVGRTFIQTSEMTFREHNTHDHRIDNAFARPFMNDPQSRNQIEVYLDSVFGPGHYATIGSDRRFIVTQNGTPVEDFNIVYITTKSPELLKSFELYPDVSRVLV